MFFNEVANWCKELKKKRERNLAQVLFIFYLNEYIITRFR